MLGKQSVREASVQRVVNGSLCNCAKFWLWKKLKEKMAFPSEWESSFFFKCFLFVACGTPGCFQLQQITYSHWSASIFLVGRRLTHITYLGRTTKTYMHVLKKLPSVLSWISFSENGFQFHYFPMNKLFFWCNMFYAASHWIVNRNFNIFTKKINQAAYVLPRMQNFPSWSQVIFSAPALNMKLLQSTG